MFLQVCGIVQSIVVYELTLGMCQIYSPAFVWDDVTTIVYKSIIIIDCTCTDYRNDVMY